MVRQSSPAGSCEYLHNYDKKTVRKVLQKKEGTNDVISGLEKPVKPVSVHFLKKYGLRSYHSKNDSIRKIWATSSGPLSVAQI